MEKPKDIIKAAVETEIKMRKEDDSRGMAMETNLFNQPNTDPRLEAVYAPFYEALSMDDINRRNEALAEAALRSL